MSTDEQDLPFAAPAETAAVIAIKTKPPDRPRPVLVGTVMRAERQKQTDPRANVCMGQVVFYREQTKFEYFYHRISKTVGCDQAAWERALSLGATWMVTYAKAERRLVLVHHSNVDMVRDYGSGKQSRARYDLCVVIEGAKPWDVPTPEKTETVEAK